MKGFLMENNSYIVIFLYFCNSYNELGIRNNSSICQLTKNYI